MANRDCKGDFFSADGANWYRCLWDATIVRDTGAMKTCPNCTRPIDGGDVSLGELPTRSTIEVNFPRWGWQHLRDVVQSPSERGGK